MELQTEGIIFISIAWVSVLTLLIYCYGKILRSENEKKKSKIN